MKKITIPLAEFNSQIQYENIPEEALTNLKKCVLDSLGCALFGSNTPWGQKVNAFVKSQGGVQEAALWATNFMGPAANVVLGNGTMIHAFDFDDYHMTKIHPGAVVVPAALAIGQKERVDGRTLLTAMVAGYETMIHISRAANPGSSRLKGWHLTGTCGTFAAAAAVGRIWELDTWSMANALGMAGTQSAGLWAFTADGSYSKRFHPGRSAQSGIMAAALARDGYRGPTMILEARDGGFFNATSYDYDPSNTLEGLGERFDTQEVVIKPYAACGSLHSSIDAVLSMRDSAGINWENIQRINVHNSEVVNIQCGFEYKPMGPLQAQMSIKYCLARALLDGTLTLAQFTDEKLSDPIAVELASKVHFLKHEEINRIYPQRFASIVEIVMVDGTKHQTRVDSPKGSVENPLSWDEVLDKFLFNASGVMPEDRSKIIMDRVKHLEDLTDASELTSLLTV
jgi:2-methylcitrate dehydratase PrpD